MHYRRIKTNAGIFFFTIVTYRRNPIFNDPENIMLLKKAVNYTRNRHPFFMNGFVILPDHLHCIWKLPENHFDNSVRWSLIKSFFTRNISKSYKFSIDAFRNKRRECYIWQKRFWEHQITNEIDFKKHLEYIHYNPVKHKLCNSPKDWAYSSFHHYVKNGVYDYDWGSNIICDSTPKFYE